MLFVITMVPNNIFGQGAYLKINAGYGLKMSSENLYFADFINSSSDNNGYTEEQLNLSLGAGLNIGTAFGYMFNKNIGAELDISYLLGAKLKSTQTYTSETTDNTLKSKMLKISPSIVISSGFEKINPYARFGVVIGTGSIVYETQDNYDGFLSVTKAKLYSGFAFGLSSGIGVVFNQSEKMSLFTEISMVNLSYSPAKGKILERTNDGVDMLPNMTTSEKEVEFVKKYIYYYSTQPDSSQPGKELKFKSPFGSVALNFGVKFFF